MRPAARSRLQTSVDEASCCGREESPVGGKATAARTEPDARVDCQGRGIESVRRGKGRPAGQSAHQGAAVRAGSESGLRLGSGHRTGNSRWPSHGRGIQDRAMEKFWQRSSRQGSRSCCWPSSTMAARFPMDVKQFVLDVPPGWKYELFMDKVPARIAPGDGCALTFRVSPPADAQSHQGLFPPQRSGDGFDVSDRSAGV